MRSQAYPIHIALLLLASVASQASACTRDDVDRWLRGKERVSERFDTSVHAAKDEAERLKQKLGAADKLKTQLEQTGRKVEGKLRAAGEDLRQGAVEVRDSLSEIGERE